MVVPAEVGVADRLVEVAREADLADQPQRDGDDGDPEDYLLHLAEEAVLGEALAALTARGVDVLGCREERSEIENAYLNLAGEDA